MVRYPDNDFPRLPKMTSGNVLFRRAGMRIRWGELIVVCLEPQATARTFRNPALTPPRFRPLGGRTKRTGWAARYTNIRHGIPDSIRHTMDGMLYGVAFCERLQVTGGRAGRVYADRQ